MKSEFGLEWLFLNGANEGILKSYQNDNYFFISCRSNGISMKFLTGPSNSNEYKQNFSKVALSRIGITVKAALLKFRYTIA